MAVLMRTMRTGISPGAVQTLSMSGGEAGGGRSVQSTGVLWKELVGTHVQSYNLNSCAILVSDWLSVKHLSLSN